MIIDNKPNLANENDMEDALNKEDMNKRSDIVVIMVIIMLKLKKCMIK